MRVLLCDPGTGLYFQSPAGWTPEADLAHDFGSSIRAAHFAQERCLNAEVYLDFGDPEYNVHLPVQSRSGTI